LEESKDKQPSQQKAPEGESKQPPAALTTAPAVRAQAPPPRPPTVTPARPANVPTPAASRPAPPKDTGRRSFMKALFVVGAILSIVPFVPWGTFLSSTVSGGTAQRKLGQQVVIDNLPDKYGSAAGKKVNVNDTTTFPPNSHWVVTYPTSGDITIDSENPDTFQKYELIRLPESLGGANKKATDFVAFSKVCVHLWCSPNYNPASGHQQYECPCHGSIYQLPVKDPKDSTKLIDGGKAVAGPASLQAFPTNAIPMLTLQADSSGNLWIFYPNRDPAMAFPNDQVSSIEANGDLGYGRDYVSYQSFIFPRGQLPGDPKQYETVVS
jgi:rieske iron-sulfur protein